MGNCTQWIFDATITYSCYERYPSDNLCQKKRPRNGTVNLILWWRNFPGDQRWFTLAQQNIDFGFRCLGTIWCSNAGWTILVLKLKYTGSTTQKAKYMGPTWGPPGSWRPQMDPCCMLTPWTLLSGYVNTTTVWRIARLSAWYWVHWIHDLRGDGFHSPAPSHRKGIFIQWWVPIPDI